MSERKEFKPGLQILILSGQVMTAERLAFLQARQDAAFVRMMQRMYASDYARGFAIGFEKSLDRSSTMAVPNPFLVVEEVQKHLGWHEGFDSGRMFLADRG